MHPTTGTRSIASLPWRYLATGSPVDVSTRRRVEGAADASRCAQLLVSFVSRLIICSVRLTRRVVIRGTLPATPCVAVSFHHSYWDGPLACMLDPRITAVTSRSWKSVPGVGAFLEAYGVIWTGHDVVARAGGHVRTGGICWLAPFGFDRSGEQHRAHTGAAQIAKETGAPIVCMTLRDDGRPRRVPARRRLTILIGRPLPSSAGDTVGRITDRLVTALHTQERAYRPEPSGTHGAPRGRGPRRGPGRRGGT